MSGYIVITGCSSGIGKQCAELLHKDGENIIATARREIDIEHLNNKGIRTLYLDMLSESSILSFYDTILKETDGNIKALINNAGYSQTGAIEDVSFNGIINQFQVNCFGPLLLTQRIIPHMRKQQCGKIIYISSAVASLGTPYTGLYSASKKALESMAESLYHELRLSNINVSIVIPGATRTSINENSKSISRQYINVADSFHKQVYEKQLSEKHSLHDGIFKYFTTDAKPVYKKIKKIINSSKPKIKYHCSFLGYLMQATKTFIPQSLFDILISCVIKRYNR